MNKLLLKKLLLLLVLSLIITLAVYSVNVVVLADLFATAYFSAKDMLFFEGLILALLGGMLLLGSGGIDFWTVKAAILQSATDAITGESSEPSKVFKRDAWKPTGFIRLGLVLIFSGIMMILAYFL